MTNQDDTLSLNDFLQTSGPQHSQTLPSIKNYMLLNKLGEGGFGVVYLADQIKPIKRKVAIKVIKPGMDSSAVIARFEAERQALALMNHPNVAKVFDAGTTDRGRPYFVMELVRGVPITQHCDHNKLSIEERLHLFIDVCEAVQHAHQKGIIHRDIKPSNILVESRDKTSIVKVIDFGVAKAIEQKLSEQTIFTQQGQLIGTPAYMSPEQAEITIQDIDTRSDIYSLGVVLYQLLTGVTPFSTQRLLQAGWDEIRRVIREQEPQKPSTKLSSIGAAQDSDTATIARNRNTNPGTLSKHLRGDLDWVTIKALEKDRARRYATATEFADDIRRHLRDEPVLASPPSSTYRFKKFIRRNKKAVSVSTIVFAMAFTSIVIVTNQHTKIVRLDKEELERKLIRAEEGFRRGAYDNSFKVAQQVLTIEPKMKRGRLLLANAASRILAPKDALDLVEQQLRGSYGWNDSECGRLHLLLANIADKCGQNEAREDHLAQAEDLFPKESDRNYARAMIQDSPTEAIRYLTEAINLDRNHFDSLIERAHWNFSEGWLDDARRDADRAERLRNKDQRVRLIMARILLSQGEVWLAFDRFSDSWSKEDNPTLLVAEIINIAQNMRYSELNYPLIIKRRTLDLQRNPKNAWAYMMRGAARGRLARIAADDGANARAKIFKKNAIADYDRAKQLGHFWGLVYRLNMRIEDLELATTEATKEVDELIARGGLAYYIAKGWCHAFRNEPTLAMNAFDAALVIDKRNFIAHLAKAGVRILFCNLGIWEYNSSQIDRIKDDFDKAIATRSWACPVFIDWIIYAFAERELKSPYELPLDEIRKYLRQHNDTSWQALRSKIIQTVRIPNDDADALALFLARIDINGMDHNSLAGAARILLASENKQLQDLELAYEYARQAMNLNRNLGLYHRLLAEVMLARGEPELAADHLQTTLEMDGPDAADLLLLSRALSRNSLHDKANEAWKKAQLLIEELEPDPDEDISILYQSVTAELEESLLRSPAITQPEITNQ